VLIVKIAAIEGLDLTPGMKFVAAIAASNLQAAASPFVYDRIGSRLIGNRHKLPMISIPYDGASPASVFNPCIIREDLQSKRICGKIYRGRVV